MGKKVKRSQQKISKNCSNCFRPTHIKFNFSFITYDHGVTEKHKADLFSRMIDLSSDSAMTVRLKKKSTGIELLDNSQLKISKQVSSKYEDGKSHRVFDGKYCIFRLYPNNNPELVRVIGHLNKNIFYVFYIDIGGKLYSH